jgi:hypothetical protein
MADMPPMDFQNGGENAEMPMGNMDGEQMPNDTDNFEGDAQFGADFDAGVEANEEEDPKKFIQQLTGKLSQSLRKYNENNGQVDADLSKYVAGMIVKQAIEGLSQEDTEEILDKIKSDEIPSEQDNQMQQGEENQQITSDDTQVNDVQQPNECTTRVDKGRISEIVNGVLDNEEETPYQQTTNKNSFKKKPFTSPNFK